MNDEPDVTSADVSRAYRNGVVAGTRHLLDQVKSGMPEEQLRTLLKWVDGPLHEWASGDDASEPPPAPLLYGA